MGVPFRSPAGGPSDLQCRRRVWLAPLCMSLAKEALPENNDVRSKLGRTPDWAKVYGAWRPAPMLFTLIPDLHALYRDNQRVCWLLQGWGSSSVRHLCLLNSWTRARGRGLIMKQDWTLPSSFPCKARSHLNLRPGGVSVALRLRIHDIRGIGHECQGLRSQGSWLLEAYSGVRHDPHRMAIDRQIHSNNMHRLAWIGCIARFQEFWKSTDGSREIQSS
ncbi:hypothetical protein VNO77_20212 [Canavalia gladiata]|uniref:Uncharacterized protein n=1 Tax=Canavalia gladiata TaxID=3824 RepID=A0AAN9LSS5_CANGL